MAAPARFLFDMDFSEPVLAAEPPPPPIQGMKLEQVVQPALPSLALGSTLASLAVLLLAMLGGGWRAWRRDARPLPSL